MRNKILIVLFLFILLILFGLLVFVFFIQGIHDKQSVNKLPSQTVNIQDTSKKKVYYAGMDLQYGESVLYSDTVFTGRVDDIEKSSADKNLIVSIQSVEFRINPSISLVTRLQGTEPKREKWMIYESDVLFDILKTKPIITLRYDDTELNQYGVIIHDYASDKF